MERVMTHHSNNHVYITARKPNQRNQMWVYDEHSKTIKSFWEMKDRNNQKRSLDSRSGHITIQNTDSRWYQLWNYEAGSGHFFTKKAQGNGHDYYAVVQSNTDTEMRAVYRENKKKTDGDNWYQLWDIIYVEDAKDLTKGYAEDWGMHINRPFHIISEWGENRFLDTVSNRVVIKTRNDRDTQVYRFDMQYRTIKSKGYSTAWSHSLDMRN